MASQLSEKEKRETLQLRREGLSLRKIARKIGCSAPTVQRICDPAAYERTNACNRRCYAKHREKRLVKANQYRESHREKYRALVREWREDHHEEVKKYRKDHHEEIQAGQKRYYAKNREVLNAKSRVRSSAFSKTPKGKLCCCNREHKRREKKEHGRGFTMNDYDHKWKQQEGKCAYCGCSMVRSKDIKDILLQSTAHFRSNYCTIDHIIPLSREGLHEPENIVLACRKCNARKHNKTPKEYASYLAEIKEVVAA